MRKIIWMLSVSVDGYFEAPGGDLTWQIVDAELHQHFNDWLGQAGGFLDGRVTWELMAQSWPEADADPDSPPQVAEFARIWRDMPKRVYSRTLTEAGWNTTIVRDVVPDEIYQLQEEAGGDLVLGGGDLAQSFLRHDLIDEFRIYVHPILAGEGRKMFSSPQLMRPLILAETRTFGSQVMMLRYERPRPAEADLGRPPRPVVTEPGTASD